MKALKPGRHRRGLLIAAGVMAIPLAALAWWLGSPLFLDTTVDETFPLPQSTAASTELATTSLADTDDPPGSPSGQPVEPGDGLTDPVPLLGGTFVDADSAHRGSGSALVYELEDGSRVLRFEDFEVTNGPDLHVLLVPTGEPISRELLGEVGYEDLGKLKGNVGNQNYDIPTGLDLEGAWTVVIYCDPFHVVFSTAQLSA